MNEEEIIKLLFILIGKTRPAGMSHVDVEVLENVKILCSIADKLHTEIDTISYEYKDYSEDSVKKVVAITDKWLERIKE